MVRRIAVAVFGVAALVVGLGLSPAWGAAGGANSATVCRITGDGTTAAALHVNEHAVAAFLRHGDSVPGNSVVGTNSEYLWGQDCVAVPKKVFAIAYTNLDGIAGYNPNADVLIAKLFDDNNDGILSAGDKITTRKYPLTFTPTVPSDFGTFQVTQHTVTGIINSTATTTEVSIGVDVAIGFYDEFEFQGYLEFVGGSGVDLFIEDTTASNDNLDVHASAPSAPDTPVSLTPAAHGPDDAFIDVEITP